MIMSTRATLLLILLSPIGTLAAHNPCSSVCDWQGVYAGLNSGYTWGDADTELAVEMGANPYFNNLDIASIQSNGKLSLHPKGYIGGVQVGYNQALTNRLLLGIETDFNLLPMHDSQSVAALYPGFTTTGYTLKQTTRTNWLFTLRPRIGYLTNNIFTYLTGGLAITRVKHEMNYSDDYFTFLGATPGYNAYANVSKARILPGWTIGAGTEYLFQEKLSVGLSYLYTRFNSLSSDGPLSVMIAGAEFDNGFNNSAKLHINALRLQLNWKV